MLLINFNPSVQTLLQKQLKNQNQEFCINISNVSKGILTDQLWWKYNLSREKLPECDLLEIIIPDLEMQK